MADIRRNLGIPSGVVFPFAGTSAPYGYLVCDGSAISRTTYADLFAMIGTAHGSGDGSTTFNLPDYRGRFLRGVDGTAGKDPDKTSRTAMATGGNTGNAVGSVQDDAMQGHFHNSRYDINGASGSSPYANVGSARDSGNSSSPTTAPITDSINGTPRTSSESRPKNVNVNYIIKI